MLELITASFTAPLYQARNSRLKNNEVIINIPIEGPTAKPVNKFINFMYNLESSYFFLLYININKICLIIILKSMITKTTSIINKY